MQLSQQSDLPNGYHVYNSDTEIEIYELTGETVYNFVDVDLRFINDEDGDRSYTTTKKEEFIQHSGTDIYLTFIQFLTFLK